MAMNRLRPCSLDDAMSRRHKMMLGKECDRRSQGWARMVELCQDDDVPPSSCRLWRAGRTIWEEGNSHKEAPAFAPVCPLLWRGEQKAQDYWG